MFSNLLSTDRINKLLSVARLILVIYIAYIAAKISISLLFPTAVISASSSNAIKAPTRELINIAELKQWNLFGASSSAQSSSSTQSAPTTNLQLQLTGVFRARDPKRSSAVIAVSGGEANLYHIGDTVSGDVILDRVYDDKVMLKRNGHLEALAFEKSDTGLLQSNDSVSDKSTDNSAPTLTQLLSPEHKDEPIAPKEFLQAFRAGIQQNPAATFAATGLRAVPLVQGGGYLVSAAAPDAVIQTTGLQRGDVVKKINGHLLGDVLVDRPLFQRLAAQAFVQVELERESRPFTLTVKVPK